MLVAGIVALFSLYSEAFSEYAEIIPRNIWPAYETGNTILSIPQVSEILRRFEEDDNIILEIRYPGGDIGRKWAESLAAWMTAFGVPDHYVELLQGSGAADQLVIAIIDRRR